MYKKYHIETSPAFLATTRIGKLEIIRDENCLNCGRCMDACIYEVHKRDPSDPRKMAEPENYLCKNCFSCIQDCPNRALQMVKSEEFENIGNTYWTPHIIRTIWDEAEEGKIPVYGAGYGGPFKGTGFDAIWTDMSEIVRPTRDGIHGREYIATAIDLGRKPSWISDFEHLKLPNSYEIQIPMLLDTNLLSLHSKNIILPVIKTAHQLKTFVLVDIDNYTEEVYPYQESLALRFPLNKAALIADFPLQDINFLEVTVPKTFSLADLEGTLENLKESRPSALISLGMTSSYLSEEIVKHFHEERVDVLHFYADSNGKSYEDNLIISDVIRKLHLQFVKYDRRDEITLIGSGGIAAAEHIPKLIICGADASVLDISLLVAMGCRLCENCDINSCPGKINQLDPEIMGQRIINMICAWRDQLLEILSAMGIRDVRRLRGEVGRAMFYEEIEKESFSFIFDKNG